MREILFVLPLIIIGCSSSPTTYVPRKDKNGYSDQTVDTNLRITTFQGNASTKKDLAELYAKFRAIEICDELGRKYTHILQVKDKTFTKQITQSSVATPNVYYGVSPYYGGYRGGYGMGMNYGVATATTTNEAYDYPLFEVYFECVETPLDARISLINLSPSQTKEIVKDVKGAIQVDDILEDSPNTGKLKKSRYYHQDRWRKNRYCH